MAFEPIPRRTLLRGAGAAIALPFLEAMLPRAARGQSAAAKSKTPVRMAVLYMPNGVRVSAWTPPGGGGPLGALPPILQPLDKLKSEILVLSGLWNRNSDTGDGHYVKCGGFLTGTTIEKSVSALNCNGVSMDQLAAQKIGALTPLPSLDLSMDPVNNAVDTNVNYTIAYAAYISWSAPTAPVPRELQPKLAFERMFTRGAARSVADDKSVLDAVLADARAVRGRVGSGDQRKLDEFLESVRAVEVRIQNEAKAAARQQETLRRTARPALEDLAKRSAAMTGDEKGRFHEADPTERVRLMLDLMVLALWTDTTRVATFMFGNEVSGRNFSFVPGVNGAFHEISHHGKDEAKLAQYEKINTWHIAQLAYLLEKMKGIKDGAGTLLDHSMVLFGSGISDGDKHNPHDLPLVLAGKGGGTIRPGRHLVFPKDSPLCNLYVSMLARLGAPVPSFADSTGELAGLA